MADVSTDTSRRSDAATLLSVEGLRIELQRRGHAPAPIARDVSLRVDQGEIVGLIGESGSGKTMTAKSLLGMLPDRINVVAGRAHYRGRDLFALGPREMRAVRGAEISLIPQDALHALNPVKTIGWQVGEPLSVHTSQPATTIRDLVIGLLERVRIPKAAARLGDYPHQFSGGMQQRALTAMALSMEPPLILADEPTTALDVTIQAEIIALIRDLRAQMGISFLFISHDLALVSGLCDRIYVMYAGEIVEQGRCEEIFRRPRHPYTRALIGAVPRLHDNPDQLLTIPGRIPQPFEEIAGCRFRDRCPLAEARCAEAPPLSADAADHATRCWLA